MRLCKLVLGLFFCVASQAFSIEVLSFDNALERSYCYSPQLKEIQWQLEASEGDILQASLSPNPNFSAEMAAFGGGGEYRGLKSAAFCAGITQDIETCGKRCKRVSQARLQQEMSCWDYQHTFLSLQAETAKRFFQLAAQQEILGLAKKQKDFAHRLASDLEDKGVDTLALRGQLFQKKPTLYLNKQTKNLRQDKQNLATLWGDKGDETFEVKAYLCKQAPLPPLQSFMDRKGNNTQLQKQVSRLQYQLTTVDLAQANGIPNISLNPAVDYFYADREYAFNFTLSFDLPIFDRNQGNIHKSSKEVYQAQDALERLESEIEQEILQAHLQASQALEEIQVLQKTLEMDQGTTLDQAFEDYENGQITLANLIEFATSYFETHEQLIEAERDYFQSWTLLKSLVGEPLPGCHPEASTAA